VIAEGASKNQWPLIFESNLGLRVAMTVISGVGTLS
jgi:hypothetical protein